MIKTLSLFFVTLLIHIFVCAERPVGEKHSRVKIDLAGNELIELAKLGMALQPIEFKAGNYFIGEFSEYELKKISKAGFDYSVLIKNVSEYYKGRNKGLDRDSIMQSARDRYRDAAYPVPENFTMGSMGGFHTYSELLDELDLMHELFPELISEREAISDINSIEGRQIYWVRISTSPQETTTKPKVLYTALTHAREPASMQQMLFQMWYLLENYDEDPEVTYLVDNLEMYFVPCVNPDGYLFCEFTNPGGGGMQRKNMRQNSDGSTGVDLNRNFGYKWGYDNFGSSPTPSSQTYRGTGPFSEPETQNLKIFAEEYEFSLALNNHTFSDLLIYPWGYDNTLTPDSLKYIEFAKFLTEENNYVYGTVYETLMYYANGVSDDWFYGEQETKNKVFAFTPEAGAPSDGFWPAEDRIIDICAGHVHMNNALAHLALPYAKTTVVSEPYFTETITDINFSIKNLGLYSPANYTVSLQAISDNISSVGDPVTFENMEVLQLSSGSIYLEVDQNITSSENIEFVVTLCNGMYQWHDTIINFYGVPEVVFFDSCDSMDNWDSDVWGVCNETYYSAPGSLADSPGGNYQNNTNAEIVLTEPIDLTDALLAEINFMTWFEIEKNWDYAQFLISNDDMASWEPLEGKYTEKGSNFQDTGKPLYHGFIDDWVLEKVNLENYLGDTIWLKFKFVSDFDINYSGFYFDDFKVTVLYKQEEDDDNFIPDIEKPKAQIYYQQNNKELIVNLPCTQKLYNFRLSIADMSGRILYSERYSENSNVKVSLSDYKPGVYIASVSGDINVSIKFVVIK